MFGYIFHAAILSTREMFRKNPDFSNFTSQTADREPNHSTHLAHELGAYFPWLSYDADVTKRDHGNQRPDIILHRRGRNRYNLLVVEVKRKVNNDVADWICASDEDKIRDAGFGGKLQYPFGLSLILDETTLEFAFALLINGRDEVFRFSSVDRNGDFPNSGEVDALIGQLIKEKYTNIDADTVKIECEIDELVFQLYGLTEEKIAIVECRNA